ncbi:MAG: bifunctional glutamate N-acetyltransferase/amino-acid acetyltransferase ArgJ [Candidatus Hodarchaeaceae archaeon]|nr:bifunctional glutamate N-acetyltransferase/amino-acid acetyltransferase ArgJ [Candidatus Hodarchaeaceae archaeon]
MITVLEGGITTVPGFRAAGVRAGIKRRGLDVMLIACVDGPVPAAGAFTTNLVKGAPVLVTAEHLKTRRLGAVVANSGSSNTYTGKRGLRDAYRMAQLTARLLKLRAVNIGVASTGLIGSYLPMRKIEAGIRAAVRELSDSREASLNAARAIMTTDTMPKEIAIRVDLEDGTPVTIAGISKGAGMIRPILKTATMLAFVVTDAAITSDALRAALQQAVDKSFNMINIDGDMSTSDMVLVMANGRAKNRRITLERRDRQFQAGLEYVLTELAWMIAKDGEGASHLIEVQVKNARNLNEARCAARTVAGSNLVKAAVFGRDPNWGRIVAALGRSDIRFDPSKLSLALVSERGRVDLVKRGKPMPKRAVDRARDLMRSKEIEIHIDLAAGKACATAWGCDLTYDYVRINSRYTT